VVVTNITSTQSGIGNILAMKRARPGVKIVAMSGGDPMGAARCLSMASHLGVARTIAKPFHVHDLIACVREIAEATGPEVLQSMASE
jgi:DNA-binding NtrC family response regulator